VRRPVSAGQRRIVALEFNVELTLVDRHDRSARFPGDPADLVKLNTTENHY
jgi:hypothetical protein